jgi:hypothetical protein
MGSRGRQAHGPWAYTLTHPAVGTGSTANIESGPKLHENKRRQPFGEDIGVLR